MEKKNSKDSAKENTNSQIKELEERIANTKYNKKTQHAIGLYKAKLAQLKNKEEARRSIGKSSGQGYTIRKTGDGSAILLGFPSVGKSTLLNTITNAKSQVGHYEFTTLDVVPGLLEHRSAKIQILDVPGIVEGAASGRGRGKEVLAVIRNADLILILIDVTQPKQYRKILKEVYDVHVRLDQRKPDVKIAKTAKGGIKVGSTIKLTKLTHQMVKDICNEFKIINADVVLREDINSDQLIDVIQGNKAYIPSLVVVNKIDMVSENESDKIKKLIKPDLLISAQGKINTERLKDIIFDKMNFIRLYLKEVRKEADMKEPLIMFKGCTINDVCIKLHRDFVSKFKFARVWGNSVKFGGMVLRRTGHILKDEDVLELHMN